VRAAADDDDGDGGEGGGGGETNATRRRTGSEANPTIEAAFGATKLRNNANESDVRQLFDLRREDATLKVSGEGEIKLALT
jgi:hypothetical protein